MDEEIKGGKIFQENPCPKTIKKGFDCGYLEEIESKHKRSFSSPLGFGLVGLMVVKGLKMSTWNKV